MAYDHAAVPQEGSAYSAGEQPNTGQPASLLNPHHYPIEGICVTCGEVIRCERLLQSGWVHTGRKPGDPIG